jgi:hypothetical protein
MQTDASRLSGFRIPIEGLTLHHLGHLQAETEDPPKLCHSYMLTYNCLGFISDQKF